MRRRSYLFKQKFYLFAATVLCGFGIYMNSVYFFSPFNLEKSEITGLSWQDIKYPMQIEYLIYDNAKGWTLNRISRDRSEIRYLIKSLEHLCFVSTNEGEVSSLKLLSYPEQGRQNLIVIRHSYNLAETATSEGSIIFQFRYYENDDYGSINDIRYFRIPVALKRLLAAPE